MTDKKINLKGGVLIIGSLLWQDYLGKDDNTIRKDWRDDRLDMDSKIKVKTPIRYGRESGRLVRTFTMTFSNSCRGGKSGIGFVIPFLNNPLKSIDHIKSEAEQLALAEGMNNTFISSNDSGPWCILGLLINIRKISKKNKTQLETWWFEQLRNDPEFGNFDFSNFKHGKEKPCILSNGLLNIPWVKCIEAEKSKELDDFDFVIATATLPTNLKYPSIDILAKNVLADNGRKYFLNNYGRGITTFQDDKIYKKILIDLKSN